MKQREPSISVIIPSYNRAAFLQKNIPDLLTLDYNDYEIIVVDDGSTDDTKKILFLRKNMRVQPMDRWIVKQFSCTFSPVVAQL